MGAKLARETGASILESPRRLHRGQALLPQQASSSSQGLCLAPFPS
ncbi:hypothetical protein AK973_3955 [Pseudomonas brassicacearum]|nr:hypothetical protein AK973_3955 [Pseudomonas brassicacearum]